jgi:hypothetical protein
MRRVAVFALLAAIALPGSAQQILTRHTVDGGGGRSENARYVLTGSIGQHDAKALMTGGPYRMSAGFFTDLSEGIFRDGFEGED